MNEAMKVLGCEVKITPSVFPAYGKSHRYVGKGSFPEHEDMIS